MNDEIKEILDYMKIKQYISETNINFGYKTLSASQVEKLLNYITNLQQENERLKFQLENQRIISSKYRMRRNIYKSRCEKASEILKKLDLDKYTYTKENRKHTINDLLNILQNGSDSQ